MSSTSRPARALCRRRRVRSSAISTNWRRNHGSIFVGVVDLDRSVQPRSDRAEDVPHPPIGAASASRFLSAASSLRAGIPHAVAGRAKQQAAASELERADALHERFLEGAADRHRLADRLHLGRERAIGLRELLEVPARNLDDDVVDRRLERGRA